MPIVSDSLKYVYVNVTKTGSQSYFKVLKRYYDGREVRRGVKNKEGYFHFTVVRNPYDRCVSLWWSTCVRGDDKYGFRRHGKDVASLVEWLHKEKGRHTFDLYLTQTEQITIEPDLVIKYEALVKSFELLPFYNGKPEKFPWINQTVLTREHWGTYMTSDAIMAINAWCDEEFARFGYKKLHPFLNGVE